LQLVNASSQYRHTVQSRGRRFDDLQLIDTDGLQP